MNRITEERKTIYISLPPGVGEGVGFMRGWSVPKGEAKEKGKGKAKAKAGREAGLGLGLDYELVAKYVGVFYHGLDVKVLPEGWFSWIRDGEEEVEV